MPLGEVTEVHHRKLCEALWSWKFCDGCKNRGSCTDPTCPAERLRHLKAFFAHFEEIVTTYDAVESVSRQATLKSHDDLLHAVEKLKTTADSKRHDVPSQIFKAANATATATAMPDDERKEVALNIVVEIALLITCAGQRHSLSALERGLHSAAWTSGDTLTKFLQDSFPQAEEQSERKGGNSVDFEGSLTASLLRKDAKIRFQPTSDLRNHLKLDRKSGVLEVFHHVAFLKEQLRLSKSLPADCPLNESLAVGALPRKLVLETLNTLQKVLFPQDDPKSRWLLRSLCSSHDFDRDCLRFEWSAIRHNTEKDLSYSYWLERLEILRDEAENPRPQGFVEMWLERRSAPRYAMLATLIGVFIAVLLGAAALAVSGYQTYIAYNAWKYPVAPASG